MKMEDNSKNIVEAIKAEIRKQMKAAEGLAATGCCTDSTQSAFKGQAVAYRELLEFIEEEEKKQDERPKTFPEYYKKKIVKLGSVEPGTYVYDDEARLCYVDNNHVLHPYMFEEWSSLSTEVYPLSVETDRIMRDMRKFEDEWREKGLWGPDFRNKREHAVQEMMRIDNSVEGWWAKEEEIWNNLKKWCEDEIGNDRKMWTVETIYEPTPMNGALGVCFALPNTKLKDGDRIIVQVKKKEENK